MLIYIVSFMHKINIIQCCKIEDIVCECGIDTTCSDIMNDNDAKLY